MPVVAPGRWMVGWPRALREEGVLLRLGDVFAWRCGRCSHRGRLRPEAGVTEQALDAGEPALHVPNLGHDASRRAPQVIECPWVDTGATARAAHLAAQEPAGALHRLVQDLAGAVAGVREDEVDVVSHVATRALTLGAERGVAGQVLAVVAPSGSVPGGGADIVQRAVEVIGAATGEGDQE
jgi:hypothetical protein